MGSLRLVITRPEDGWRVYAFEADEAPEAWMPREIAYESLESAKVAAFETATELLGYSLRPDDLEWTVTVGRQKNCGCAGKAAQ